MRKNTLFYDHITNIKFCCNILFFFAGRTFVHHAVKRFMVILPAIFFKLGIAFTLLIIVSLVAVNNGIIGFLILVVGLSSVLARLQQAQPAPVHAHAVPLIAPPPPWAHHFLDRSDSSPPVFNKGADYRNGYSKVHYSNQLMDRSDTANYAAQVQRLNDLLQLQQRNAQVTPVYGNTEVVYNGYAKTS